MNKTLIVGAALLVGSLFPGSANAASVPAGAVCTQLEPSAGRSGISFFGGTKMCRMIASMPDLFDYPIVPIKEGSFKKLHLVCGWPITTDESEYALAWSAYGYEPTSYALCNSMRDNGIEVSTFDTAFPPRKDTD